MTKKRTTKTSMSSGTKQIIGGIFVLLVMPLTWVVLDEIFTQACKSPCDISSKISTSIGILATLLVMVVAGLILLIIGITKNVKLHNNA